MALGHGEVAKVNRYLVLEYFRDHPDATRTDAARALALSGASVSRIVGEMLRDQVLIETGTQPNGDSPGGPGRPSIGLRVNQAVDCVVAIDLGASRCIGRLATTDGETIKESICDVPATDGAFEAIESVWDELRKDAISRGLKVSNLVLGIPAVMDPVTGLVWRGPNVGWEGFDLRSRLEEFGVPFVIENDTSLSAIAEGQAGSGQHCSNFVLLTIGSGLGSALVINGSLVAGHSNAAGELSDMVVNREQVREHRRGRHGGLESYLSASGIAQFADDVAQSDPTTPQLLSSERSIEGLLDSAQRGSHSADAAIKEIAEYLALAIINLASVVDPEIVIIDGSVGRRMEPLFERVRELVSRHIPRPPEIRASSLEQSTIRGAVTLAVNNFREDQAPAVFAALSEIRN